MQNLYTIAITAVIVKDGKYLITRRAATKKKWPGKWTVPGGNLEPADYELLPKDTVNAWYNILEKTIRREVKEEVGLEIKNIDYLTSLVGEYGPDVPHSLILSMVADWESGEVVLQEEETDQYAWVTLEEAKNYDLIPGIYEELELLDRRRREEPAKRKKQ